MRGGSLGHASVVVIVVRSVICFFVVLPCCVACVACFVCYVGWTVLLFFLFRCVVYVCFFFFFFFFFCVCVCVIGVRDIRCVCVCYCLCCLFWLYCLHCLKYVVVVVVLLRVVMYALCLPWSCLGVCDRCSLCMLLICLCWLRCLLRWFCLLGFIHGVVLCFVL